MIRKHRARLGALTVVGALGATALAGPGVADAVTPTVGTGPSTVTDPYVIPVPASGVYIESLLTVNDAGSAGNGYEMVGIPDGAGGYLTRNGAAVRLNVNHELGSGVGITRAHGAKGAFVSTYTVDPTTRRIDRGRDLAQTVWYYDTTTDTFVTAPTNGESAAIARLCSGTTAARGQLKAPNGYGTSTPIHFAGEESGAEGRAFAFLPDGTAKQLPWLGRTSWENVIPAPNQSRTTLVMGTDDAGNGRLTAYVGTKLRKSKVVSYDAFQLAGLENGTQYSIALPSGELTDAAFRAAYDVGDQVPFTLVSVDADQTGAAQDVEAAGKGALLLNRIEDGAFDPSNPDDFYFLTTDGGEGSTPGGGGGLWRLRYTDIEQPTLGGTLELLLDGTEAIGLGKPDNMGIDTDGNLLIQEDPGGDDFLARIVAYRISDGAIGEVATFDPALFDPAVAGPDLWTNDEESSGIFDASGLFGAGWWVFDAQVHTAAGLPAGPGADTVEEYVENGQLLAMQITDWTAVYGS